MSEKELFVRLADAVARMVDSTTQLNLLFAEVTTLLEELYNSLYTDEQEYDENDSAHYYRES